MASAQRIVFRETGKPEEVLEIETFDPPSPGEGEVLLHLLAAPLNPADLNTVEGTYGVKPPLPATPGIEGCAVVAESRSPGFEPGDRVLFLKRAASWASHLVLPADALFKLPAGIDPLQAALLKVNPATAWRLLHDFAALQPGDWIVQNAGNSAVGRCVIQLAADLGIRTLSFARKPVLESGRFGGDHVFSDDDAGRAAAKEALGGANAALAFNAVGGESALGLLKLLRPGGTHITYGAMGRRPVSVPNGLLIFRDLRVRGLWVTRWLESAPLSEIHALYQELARRVAGGTLSQPVDSTYPLADFRQALARLESPERDGKVLLIP